MKNNIGRVIVTGCAGHIGAMLTEKLLIAGYNVVGIDKLVFGENLAFQLSRYNNFLFLKKDINGSLDFLKINKNDCIIHIAALVGPVCEMYKKIAEKTNFMSAIKIAKIAKKKRAKFIFLSTCSNYGKSETIVDENSKLTPLGKYAQTKVKSELKILSLTNKFKVLRLGTICGISLKQRFDTMFNEWIFEGYKNKKISIYQENAFRPFIHIEDATDIIIKVLQKYDKLKYQVYNIMSFNVTKIKLAREIKKRIKGLKIVLAKKSKDMRDYKVSRDRFDKEFNYKFKYNLSRSLFQVLNSVKTIDINNRETYDNTKYSF